MSFIHCFNILNKYLEMYCCVIALIIAVFLLLHILESSKCTRLHLQGPIFKNISGRAYPQTPLEACNLSVLDYQMLVTFIWPLATQKSLENTVSKTITSKHLCLWWSILLKIFEFMCHLICVPKQSVQDFFQPRQNDLSAGNFTTSGAIVATYSTKTT